MIRTAASIAVFALVIPCIAGASQYDETYDIYFITVEDAEDENDSVGLNFGGALRKFLYYDRALDLFHFTGGVYVEGDLTVTGLINGYDLADLGGGGEWSTVISSADVSDSTAGGSNDVPDLTVPVDADTRYKIRCNFTTVSAATTTGIQMTVNGPSSPTQVSIRRQSCSSATAMIITQKNAFGSEDARTASAGTTRCMESIDIDLENGANAGDVTFSLDTETSASAVTAYEGAYCEYRTY